MLTLFSDFQTRSPEPEYMDDPEFSGEELGETFRFIWLVNLFGGGRWAVKIGLSKILREWPKEKPVEILDVGCGIGDIGCGIVSWGKRRGYAIRYTGLERSLHTLRIARARAKRENIRFVQGDLFSNDIPEADIVIASMVLHHFEESEIIKAISNLHKKSRTALIINDLERSRVAYAICRLLTCFFKSRKSRFDALLSVRKGFTEHEMRKYFAQAGIRGHVRRTIGWRILAMAPQVISASTRPKVDKTP